MDFISDTMNLNTKDLVSLLFHGRKWSQMMFPSIKFNRENFHWHLLLMTSGLFVTYQSVVFFFKAEVIIVFSLEFPLKFH